jgi:hypothetical protein
MHTMFTIALLTGGIILAIQVVLSLIGIDKSFADADLDASGGESPVLSGAELLSVRSMAAAAAVFGATGLALERFIPAFIAAMPALIAGFGAAVLNAYLTRLMLRVQSDGSLRLADAIGATGTVYLPVPGSNAGAGIVQFALQGRTVELRAVTRESAALPTGTPVLVVSVDPAGETVEVVSTSSIEALS